MRSRGRVAILLPAAFGCVVTCGRTAESRGRGIPFAARPALLAESGASRARCFWERSLRLSRQNAGLPRASASKLLLICELEAKELRGSTREHEVGREADFHVANRHLFRRRGPRTRRGDRSRCGPPKLQIMLVASPRKSLQYKLHRYNSCGAAIVRTRCEPAVVVVHRCAPVS